MANKDPRSPDELVLALYAAARESPAHEFQGRALQLIKPWLQFASGIWACGLLQDGFALKVHAAHLHDVSPESLAEWQQINRQDKVIPEAVEKVGQVLAYHAPTLFCAPEDAVMRDYAAR